MPLHRRTVSKQIKYTPHSKLLMATVVVLALTFTQPPRASAEQGATKGSATVIQAQPATNNDDLVHRIRLLELRQAEPADSKTTKVTVPIATALIGCLAVFLAAVIGMVGQWLAARNTARLATKAAQDAHDLATEAVISKRQDEMMEFKLKQVELFYAPVFAALRQSRTLYDKLLEQLIRNEPTRYRRSSSATASNFRFVIIDEQGREQPFYLVDQLPAIRRHASAMKLIDAMLALGRSICERITIHAGLASADLVEMLGIYMAHHAILSAIRDGDETTPFEPGHNKLGAFPYELDDKVESRLQELSQQIDLYATGSGLTSAMRSGGSGVSRAT